MYATMKAMWHDLSAMGRMWVLIVLLLAVTGLLAMAMWLGGTEALNWIPGLLNKAIP